MESIRKEETNPRIKPRDYQIKGESVMELTRIYRNCGKQ
jgi:hypothetical protein